MPWAGIRERRRIISLLLTLDDPVKIVQRNATQLKWGLIGMFQNPFL
jgi:hypothetical protein